MSSNIQPQNEGVSDRQPQRSTGTTSSGIGALFRDIPTRAPPIKPSRRFPQLDIERGEGATQEDREWEDNLESFPLEFGPAKTAAAPKSALHAPPTTLKESSVVFQGDVRRSIKGESRQGTSERGSARSGGGDVTLNNLNEENPSKEPAPTALANRRAAHLNTLVSPTTRQPFLDHMNPMVASKDPPLHEADKFLADTAPLGTADLSASLPLTSSEVRRGAEVGALRTEVGDGIAAYAYPDAYNELGGTGFDTETGDLDPHYPLAGQESISVPSRNIRQRRPHGTAAAHPSNSTCVFVRANGAKLIVATAVDGTLMDGGNTSEEVYSPQQHPEEVFWAAKTDRPGKGGPGNGPSGNPMPGTLPRPGVGEERQRIERQRQREFGGEPYPLLDPEGGDSGSDESSNGTRRGPRHEGEGIPMTRRQPSRARDPRQDGLRTRSHPTTGITQGGREAQSGGKDERWGRVQPTRVNAHKFQREMQQGEARLATQEAERDPNASLVNGERREEPYHGLSGVLSTSPIWTNTREEAGTPSLTTGPVVDPHPGGVESAPLGRLSRSPPASSFNLGGVNVAPMPRIPMAYRGIDAKWQFELKLREWMRFALLQAYRHIFLRMPSLYFGRVARVFAKANLMEMDFLIAMALEDGPNGLAARALDERGPWRGVGESAEFDAPINGLPPRDGSGLNHSDDNPRHFPRRRMGLGVNGDQGSNFGLGAAVTLKQNDLRMKEALGRLESFYRGWEAFIDVMVEEWKTLNVVSALLLSALLTVFQIPEATYVPVTRTAALLSLVSALMSLIFGVLCITQFSAMRTTRKALRFVENTHGKKPGLFWNVWILLSLPATWLVYSLIFFCIAILGFVWTSGTGTRVSPSSSDDNSAIILGPRIGVTALFLVGIIYVCLVLKTFGVWSSARVGMKANSHWPDPGYYNRQQGLTSILGGSGESAGAPSSLGMREEITELDAPSLRRGT